MAKKIFTEPKREGGLEGNLSLLGIVLLILACVNGAAVFYYAGIVTRSIPRFKGMPEVQYSLSVEWILVSINVVVFGVILYFICQTAAEMIRIRKRSEGLPYGGEISKPYAVNMAVCSECGAEVQETYRTCPGCGGAFEELENLNESPSPGGEV